MRALIERLVPAAACLIRVLPLSDLRFYTLHRSRFQKFAGKARGRPPSIQLLCASSGTKWRRTDHIGEPICQRPSVSALPPGAMRKQTALEVRLMHRSKGECYSITLSACATNPAGISRPSSLAALRLMTSSQWLS